MLIDHELRPSQPGDHLECKVIGGEYEWLVASIDPVLVFRASYNMRSGTDDMSIGIERGRCGGW